MHGPERILHTGYKFEVEGRHWPRFIDKLMTPGSEVKIVALGGSVTVGYRFSNTSYPEQFASWLQEAFPETNITILNMARRATAATFAALCVVQDVPADSDLVLIEYSINGYGGQCQCFTSPQVAGYETLLRKVIKRAPKAALMSFAAFMWLDKHGNRTAYFETGEDQHAVMARRYAMPMMSVRDAMFDIMLEPDNPYGIDQKEMLVDVVHVSDKGAALYASFLAWAFRHQLTRILLHHRDLQQAVKTEHAMPPPLNPDAAQEDWPTFCAEGPGLQKVVAGNDGWDWVDEGSNACPGCHKYGFASERIKASMTFALDSDVITAEDAEAGAQVMLAISYLRSYSEVGHAYVECVAGCTCKPKLLDGKNKRATSEIFTDRMPISPHKQCNIKIRIKESTSTGKHKFRISGLAVHKQDKIMSTMYAPVYD